MNSLTPVLAPGLAPHAPATADVVRSIPRRITGFSTTIETSVTPDVLQASLEVLAEDSAFTLLRLRETDDVSPTGGRFIEAEFALRAIGGTTGDPQIFALLRALAGIHRWNGVEKRIAR